jgi:hypothetical protein
MQEIDLGINFDYNAALNKIINITYDDTKGYKANGMECFVGLHDDGDKSGVFPKIAFDSIKDSIKYRGKYQYCTTPVVKTYGDKDVVLSLPLEKIA